VRDDKLEKLINSNYDEHIKSMVTKVMQDAKIDNQKWFQNMLDFTLQTVSTVRPNSLLLHDPIDIKPLVKIVTVEYQD
jgi:hypothetical protein